MVSVVESFGRGFALTSTHFERLIGPTLAIGVMEFISFLFSNASSSLALHLLFGSLIGILGAAAYVWLFSTALEIVTGEQHPFRWSAALALWGYLILIIVLAYGLLLVASLSFALTAVFVPVAFMHLLLWPALIVYLLVRFTSFVPEIAADDREVGAFKRSWELTAGRFWQLMRFFVLSLCVSAAGLLALGVGLLFAIPMVVVSSIYFYEQLRQ